MTSCRGPARHETRTKSSVVPGRCEVVTDRPGATERRQRLMKDDLPAFAAPASARPAAAPLGPRWGCRGGAAG